MSWFDTLILVLRADPKRSLASKKGEPKRKRNPLTGKYDSKGAVSGAPVLPDWLNARSFFYNYKPSHSAKRSWLLSDGKFYVIGGTDHEDSLRLVETENKDNILDSAVMSGMVRVFPYQGGDGKYMAIHAAKHTLTDAQMTALRDSLYGIKRTSLSVNVPATGDDYHIEYADTSNDPVAFDKLFRSLRKL